MRQKERNASTAFLHGIEINPFKSYADAVGRAIVLLYLMKKMIG